MKKLTYLFLITVILGGCTGDDPVFFNGTSGTEYKPVLMTRAELEKSVSVQPAKTLAQAGKIYIKDSLLFISEKYKGIHIYDNKNPADPKNLAFIYIPGCVDIAVKNNVIYADNATDLVAIDISNINSPQVSKRIPDVFPEMLPPDADVIPTKFLKENRPENTIIVGWEKY